MIGMCRHDAAVHEAIRTGEWTPALHQHVSGCARCTEAVAISRLLQRHAVPDTLGADGGCPVVAGATGGPQCSC